MVYDPTVWKNGQAPAIDATRLNKIEQGVASAHTEIHTVSDRVTVLEGGAVVVAPVASFTYTTAALAATFDGSASTAPTGRTVVSYHWNFGEGGGIVTTAGPVVSHNFGQGGLHDVTLFVLDSEGVQSPTAVRSVTVLEPANVGPTASFTTAENGLTVAFNASGSSDPDGSIVSFTWVYGDGTTGTGPNPIKKYSAAGQYTVALTVTDDDGATHQTTRAVTVTSATAPSGTDGVTFLWVESVTPNESQNNFAAKMVERGATLNRIPDTTPAATVASLAAQPATVLVVMDGTSTSNLTANVMPTLNGNVCPSIVYKYGLVDDLGWATSSTQSTGGTSLYVLPENFGKVTSAGKGAGAHAITSASLSINYWDASFVPAEAEKRLYSSDVFNRVTEFVYPAESSGGWRAAASFWFNSVDPAQWTANVYDFGYALMVEAASVAREGGTPGGTSAPVLAVPTQIETSSTGGRIRLTATVADPTHDVLWFSAESYAKDGLHFAITEGDGTTTTRVRDTAEGTFVAPGPQEYWTKARATDDTLSVESNHRQYTVTSTGGGTTPGTSTTTATILEPFKNSVGQRVRMANGSQGPVIPPVWWLGQPTSGVVYEPENSPATQDVRRTDVLFTINQGQYGHQVRIATVNDPLARVEDRNDSGRTVTGVHIPLDLVAAVGNDGHAHVVQPPDADGRTWVAEMIGFRRVDSTNVSASRVHLVPMDGAGLGPAAGVRAYGGSAVAGLIRAWEVDPSHPNYTGKIEHVLAFAGSWRQMKHMAHPTLPSINQWEYYSSGSSSQTGQPGWPGGTYLGGPTYQTNPEGFIKRQMAFPVTEEDHSGKNDYFGQIPMGTLFVIPPSVTAASLGITRPESLMIFNALRDYGMMLVDTVGSDASMPLYVETNAPRAWRSAISTSNFTYPDLAKMRTVLRAVANSRDITTPNGGPVGVARRGKAVPGFQ